MKALFGLLIGLALSLSLAAVVGEDPTKVLMVLVKSGVGSADDLATSLFYATSLMFTGLAVAISFRAGLFNIGAEGQLNFGALVSTLSVLILFGSGVQATAGETSLLMGLPKILLAACFAFAAGAIWGGTVGLLKAYRGSHEVVLTMMMNFIAAGLLSYFVVGPFQSTTSQNPETAFLPAGFQMVSWDPLHAAFPNTPINLSLVLAVGLCLFFWWFFKKTRYGFEWRVAGAQLNVAASSGVSVKRTIVTVLAVSGGIAGLVVLNDIFGSAGKLRLGFSPEYGFIGIAVALLARNHPLAVIPSAILFGILHKGAADLDLETEVINRDFAKIIQATIILSVIASSALPSVTAWLKKRKEGTTSKV